MQPADYQRLRRRLLRDGQIDDAFWQELRRIAEALVRRRVFPPSYAPYGAWNAEAQQEVFQSWATERLIARGQLRAIVAQAAELSAFRAMSEISLRQHLINLTERSQSQNLYARLQKLLADDDSFLCFTDSPRRSNRWYGLAAWTEPRPFDGNERRLQAASWSMGQLSIVRYRNDAKKLSPLLDADELRRFALGILEALGQLLTPGLMLRGLQLRVDLSSPEPADLESVTLPADQLPTADTVAVGELAVMAIAELTRRQVDVLIGTDQEQTLDQLAAALGCSRVTVLNEQLRAGAVLRRLTAHDGERDQLLNKVLELLYEAE